MKQRIIFFLFTLVSLPYMTVNAAGVLINGLNYELNDTQKTAKVVETSGVSGNLVIPSEVAYNDIIYKVTSVDNWAFQYNSDITSLSLGSNLFSIGMYSFSECTGLTSLVIPDNVTELNLGSFEGCTGLTTVTVGTGITEVVGFGNCTALTSVILPETLKSIGFYAFQGCEKLVSILVPQGVDTIDEESFDGCISLETFNVSKNVTLLESSAFKRCRALKAINVDADNSKYSSKNGVVYDKKQTSVYLVPPGIVGPITIPSTVEKIKSNSFRDCWSLESVVISEGVKEIGNSAFRDCDKLASLILPESLEKIDDWAFSSCIGLVSLTLPSSLNYMGYNVFTSCEKLLSINIPDKVTEIMESTFSLCSSLAKIDLGSGLLKIGNKVFSGCLDLDTIVVPKSVTTIGDEAFTDCKALNSITLGQDVNTIGNKAFSNCPNIKEILMFNPIPPICGTGVFYMTIANNSKIYVPKGTMEAYKNAEVWKAFKKMAELYEDGKKPLTITVSKVGNGVIQIDGTDVESSATVKEGSDLTITFKPSDGYILTSVILSEEEIIDEVKDGQYVVKNVLDNLKLSVEFKEGYIVNVTNRDDIGTVTVNGKPAPVSIEKGQPVEFAVTLSAVYYISNTLLDGQEVQLGEGNTYKVNSIDKNLTFEVEYESYRAVLATFDKNLGNVKINDQEVAYYKARKNEELKFTITPVSGYKINTVKLNDVSVTSQVKDGVYKTTIIDDISYGLEVTFIRGSSIDMAVSDAPIVYTSDGKVCIENVVENTLVTIVDSKGEIIYQGNEKEIKLNNGLYIVKLEDKAVKVIVK